MSNYSNGARVLYAVFEGRLPNGDLAGFAAYTGLGGSREELDKADRDNIRFLEMKHSGIQGAKRITAWTETTLPTEDGS